MASSAATAAPPVPATRPALSEAPRQVPYVALGQQFEAESAGLLARLQGVLASGQWVAGPEVAELEGKLAERLGARECIAVGSGTDALILSLRGLGIGPGDEVITPGFTYIATADPEFRAWAWVDPAELVERIVPFKRATYAAVLAAFADRLAEGSGQAARPPSR